MSKSTSAELIEEMNEIIAKADAARQKMIDKGSQCFEKYLSALFEENAGLELIVIRGYTPGFNDGDPCYHSMHVMVDGGDFDDWGMGRDAYIETSDGEESDEDSEDKDINADLDKAEAKKIRKHLEAFDDVLESMHGTNWQLTAKRNADGKMLLQQTEYDCGH